MVDDHPTWSPDGSRIAFVSYRHDLQQIYVINAEGSNLTQLTNEYGFAPSGRLTGARIAFNRDGGT